MSERAALRSAVGVSGFAVMLTAAGLLLRAEAGSSVHGKVSGVGIGIGTSLAALAVCSLGTLIVRRAPRNIIGWTFLAAGAGLGLGGFSEIYWAWNEFGRETALPGTRIAETFYNHGGPLLWTPLFALLLLFPDGRPLPGIWRWLAGATAVVLVGGLVDPFIGTGFGDHFWSLLNLMLLLAGAAVIVRFRRSRGVERQQMKWIAASGALVLTGTLVLLATVSMTEGASDAWWQQIGPGLLVTGFASLPLAATVAITRYRLYELDRLVSRAAAYGVAVTAVIGLYAGSVLLAGAAIPSARDSDLAVAVSTLVAAAAFTPLQSRIRVTIDRRFHRQRYDATVAVERLGSRLRHQVDDALLVTSVTETLTTTLRPAHVGIWMRPLRGG